jgi:2-phosphosulfolactate phosphatase
MRIERATNENCDQSVGTVVVIDVLRAFTMAAVAFGAGAKEIVLASTVDEAFALRKRFPDALLMGEIGGLPPPGFDFGNSPAELGGHDLKGRRIIQRTSAGTQGVVRCSHVETLLTCSFVCVGATAQYIMRRAVASLTLVITGVFPGCDGDEDVACADYLTALLCGERPDVVPFLNRVRDSHIGRHFTDPTRPEFPMDDLSYCTAVDCFDFAMLVERNDGLLVMKAASV